MEAAGKIFSELLGVFAEMAPWLLLGFAIAGILHVFMSDKFVLKHLAGKGLRPIVNASMLGVPLPLCSCSVIPVGASLNRRGAGPGATAGFLISAPQTGVDSILVTYSLMGPVFAIFRVFAAFFSGLFGGMWVDKVSGHGDGHEAVESEDSHAQNSSRIVRAIKHGFVTLPGDLAKSLSIGLAIAAGITVLLPPGLLADLPGGKAVTMLAMLVMGLPIYVCATASVPIAAAFMFSQGVSPGAALVFLMSGPATNAATVLTLKKMLGGKSVLAYLAAVMLSAIVAGVALDLFVAAFGSAAINKPEPMTMENISPMQIAAMITLVILLIRKPVLDLYKKFVNTTGENPAASSDLSLKISGMTCPNCAAKIEAELNAAPGVEQALVDLKSGASVKLADNVEDKNKVTGELIELIGRLGYQASCETDAAAGNENCCGHDY